MSTKSTRRCAWVSNEPLYIAYHDEEWGVPSFDEQHLFAMLMLEGQQAGLSWITILKRRQGYFKCYKNFDAKKIAKFDETDIERLVQDERIIRSRAKIKSIINNAKAYLALRKSQGSFSDFLWEFVGHEPQIKYRKSFKDIPALTEISTAMAKALKQHGFSFVGPTICYAFMQAVGMVNDHEESCDFR